MPKLSGTADSLALKLPPVYDSGFLDRYYLHSPRPGEPLRVGLLIDSDNLTAPFATVVDQILRSNFADIVAVIENASASAPASAPARPSNKFRTVLNMLMNPKLRSSIGFKAYSQLVQKFRPTDQDLLRNVDCSAALAGAARIAAIPLRKGFVDRFSPETVEQVRAMKLDVLLRFGFNIIRGDILTAALYGVWSYHHGDNEFYRGGPPGFWEVYENNPCTGVILQVLTEELDGGLVLDKTVVSSELGISYEANRVKPYVTASRMMVRALQRLHAHGWDEVVRHAPPPAPYRGKRKLYRSPGNVETARFVAAKAGRMVSRRVTAKGDLAYHWRIGMRRREPGACIPASVNGVRWLDSPRGTFHADPFVVQHQERTWVFVEEYVYARERARVVCAEVSDDGNVGSWQAALEEPWHLSFPFVFEAAGAMFMIPEAGESGKVTLYRAHDFPNRWVPERVLLDYGGLDTVAFQHDDQWWFFITMTDPRLASPQLCLFSARSLFSELLFHPSNPISSDIRHSRCAGRIHRTSSGLVRAAQDGALRYGHALHFRKIDELSPSRYRESALSSIYPDASARIVGIHSWDCTDSLEVFDHVRWESFRDLA